MMEFIYTLMPHDLLKIIQIAIPLFWDDRTRVVWVYYPLQVFIIDWLLMFVNQTQEGADLKVPFAVTRHLIWIKESTWK